MSLYGHVDRDAASKPRERFEFLLVYSICWVVLLIPTAMRRLLITGGGVRSIIDETRSMAANCAASSFMGM